MPSSPFIGEERQRVQELCAGLDGSLLGVEAVGLVICGEVELVRQVHTLFVRSAQQVVVFELQVREEVEIVRQEVREVKGESKAEEKRSTATVEVQLINIFLISLNQTFDVHVKCHLYVFGCALIGCVF